MKLRLPRPFGSGVLVRTRPRQVRTRTARLTALGVAPVLIAGGIVATGTGPGAPTSTDGINLAAGSQITLIGHGHGHGRGMGQWGAFGYAKRGWTAPQILRHYYGGTTAGKVGNPDITVTLSQKDSVNVRADAGMRVGGRDVTPGQAVSLSGGNATITEGCGGAVVDTVPASLVEPLHPGPNRPENEWLRFCGSGDAFRGALGLEDGRVVNKAHVDDYIKGVIAKESYPNWADEGGAEALKAQAIAARSYALAAIAGGKKIDDTQGSQVYAGVSGEDARTNPLADQTAGQIILLNGQPALAEYSASTGGYTAGGMFPAVIDEGDALSPTRDWTATIPAASVGQAFGVGELRSFEVIEANGLGAQNGRAIKVRAVGSGGTVEATGEEARVKLQIKSSFFSVEGQQAPPRIVTPPTGPGGGGFGSVDLGPLTQLGDLVPDLQGLLDMATGALNGRFDELGGAAGPLGTALAPAVVASGGDTPASAVVVQLFEKGMMLFSEALGVRALSGNGLAEYQEQGGLAALGMPEGDALE